MSKSVPVLTFDLGFTLELIEPEGRIAQEKDIDPLDQQFESQLSIIGRICAGALVAAVGLVLLAIFFKSPLALLGVVGMLTLVAATLRVGEFQHKRYVAAQRSGMAQGYEFPRS